MTAEAGSQPLLLAGLDPGADGADVGVLKTGSVGPVQRRQQQGLVVLPRDVAVA